MADASSDWAGRPVSDQALSSDEEDFVSSQSTASADPESRTQKLLSSALGKLNLDTPQLSNQSCDHRATRTFTPDTSTSVLDASMAKSERKKLELLDLPLDVLKDIVKEVRKAFLSHPSPSFIDKQNAQRLEHERLMDALENR
jgi:hypothetical protein